MQVPDSTRKLFVLRHGKAEAYNQLGDRARDLAPRGRSDAQKMGKLIASLTISLDLVISSDAARASQTAAIAGAAAGYCGEIAYRADLYAASVNAIAKTISSVPSSAKSLLMVGHNPGLEEFCEEIGRLKAPFIVLPTCGLAGFEIAGDWHDFRSSEIRFLGLWQPKTL